MENETKKRLIPNPDIQLYDYQQDQVEFVRKTFLRSNIAGIESSTGSGKTFVALDVAMNYLRSHPDKNVIITTGFNNLVYLMKKRAIQYGFPEDMVKVLMGKGRINCPITWKKENQGLSYEPFTETHYACTEDHLKEGQSMCEKASKQFKNIVDDIVLNKNEDENGIEQKQGRLIITNDSMFLIFMNSLDYGLVVVDEAHTFNNFYQSYKKREASPSIMNKTNEVIENNKILQDSFVEAIKSQVPLNKSVYSLLEAKARDDFFRRRVEQRNKIYEKNTAIEEAREAVKSGTFTKGQQRLAELEMRPIKSNYEITKLVEKAIDEVKILSEQNDYNNYINVDQNHYFVEDFYYRFQELLEQDTKILLLSATIDQFTKIMFDTDEHNIYREKKQFVDYTKSNLLLFPDENKKPHIWSDLRQSMEIFLEYVKNQHSGLLLFTTNNNMNSAWSELNGRYGFKFFRNKEDFEEYNGKKILIGSKALFQGIDIPGLDFVALDKFPFPNFDEHEQKLQDYLKTTLGEKFNPWNMRTMPLMINDIIQATGRLWRGKDDYGTVAILDPRNMHWSHTAIRKGVIEARPGINTFVYQDGNFYTNEEAQQIIKRKKEKQKAEEDSEYLLKKYPQLSKEDKLHPDTKIIQKEPLIVEIGGQNYSEEDFDKIKEGITFVEVNATKQFILAKESL